MTDFSHPEFLCLVLSFQLPYLHPVSIVVRSLAILPECDRSTVDLIRRHSDRALRLHPGARDWLVALHRCFRAKRQLCADICVLHRRYKRPCY